MMTQYFLIDIRRVNFRYSKFLHIYINILVLIVCDEGYSTYMVVCTNIDIYVFIYFVTYYEMDYPKLKL